MPWADIAIVSVLGTLALAVTTISIVKKAPLPAILISAAVAISTGVGGYFWVKSRVVAIEEAPRPKFTTSQGVYLFVGPDLSVDFSMIERALDHFATMLPALAPEDVTEAKIRTFFKGATISFDTHPTKEGRGWAGEQSGKWMRLHWEGDLAKSEFFHELLHMADEFLRGRIDFEHKDKAWFALKGPIEETFE